MELFYRCFRLKLMLHKSRLSCLGQCILIYSDIKGVLFHMREETEFMQPDETLKQGRNRSWLLQKKKKKKASYLTSRVVCLHIDFQINSSNKRVNRRVEKPAT